MDRREFLALGAGSLAAAPITSVSTQSADVGAASLLRDFTAEDHRRRLRNIALCTQSIQSCLRKHLVTNYLPGQCCYNLGEYPARRPWSVDEYDEQELDRLRAHGIQLLQVFDDWNDSLRLFGGDKYSAVNPEGYRRFIEMAHRRGMKVLTYTSTCFLQRSDPDFRQEWSRDGDFLVVGYWDMARCSPASPGWRAFVLRKISQVLDEYGADGIYVDGGYLANKHAAKRAMPLAKDEVPAFDESPQHDGAFADLLALIYADVKRRGGVLKLHVNGAERPEAAGLKTYDYLWAGEGVANADALRESVKNFDPYVVPCIDMGFASIENADDPYLHAVPYMQFPVTMGGRIFTGERGTIEGVKYHDDFWMQRCRDAWKLYQTDPGALHTYSAWDAVPGGPAARTTHARWLKLYRAMTGEGAWAWIEIGDSALFPQPLPRDVVASAFANRNLYLVLANYGRTETTITTGLPFVRADADAAPSQTWPLAPRSLLVLRYADTA